MEIVDVTVYYLEMIVPSRRSVRAPRDGLTVSHIQTPSVPYYRSLYDSVGKDYHWLSRRKLSDEQLATVIQDSRNELHVLHVDGSSAGFAELDRRQTDEIELVQFGLIADYIGQGLGKWFLQWTIDKAWSYEPGDGGDVCQRAGRHSALVQKRDRHTGEGVDFRPRRT